MFSCEADYYCNYDASLCAVNTSDYLGCVEACVTNAPTASFCGVCEDVRSCVEISLNESQCLSLSACELPNGTLIYNVSEQECQEFGMCTDNCPPKCRSSTWH